MNGLDAVGMNTMSAEELEQVEGGFAVLLGGLIGIGATVGGYVVAKAIMEGGGREALPGLGQFLVGTTAIATAAGGRPS